MAEAAGRAAVDAAALYRSATHGFLATQSRDAPGYPFGSLVAYYPAADGSAVLLMSDLAQHTANVRDDAKASLTVVETGEGDPAGRPRLTLIGDVEPLPKEDEESRRRYRARFPGAFGEDMGFRFYRLKPVRARFIGGFGKVGWIEPGALRGQDGSGS